MEGGMMNQVIEGAGKMLRTGEGVGCDIGSKAHYLRGHFLKHIYIDVFA
jgi:hypothetical protein